MSFPSVGVPIRKITIFFRIAVRHAIIVVFSLFDDHKVKLANCFIYEKRDCNREVYVEMIFIIYVRFIGEHVFLKWFATVFARISHAPGRRVGREEAKRVLIMFSNRLTN